MAGHDAQRLRDSQIQEKLAEPIHTDSLRKLASGKEEAVIIFDDMTRPTQCSRIVPHVLAELGEAGIKDEHVRFIVALGAHGADNRLDFVKKLGEEVVERFPIYNHNPFENLQDLGTTTMGTPVQINSEVMACDLKIGIGSIIPHSMAGFGGGGKIILPGVASIEGICHNHRDVAGEYFDNVTWSGWRQVEGNPARADIDEAARMAGLDFKVDTIVNGLGEISGIFAGDHLEAWKKGVEVAKRAYWTDSPAGVDVVVANAYLKPNQAISAMNIAAEAVHEGGTIVLIANAPEGQHTHYLYGKFGKNIGGRLRSGPPSFHKHFTMAVYSEYSERDPLLEVADSEQIIWTNTWTETIEVIRASIQSDRPKVAIFPAADVQVTSSAFLSRDRS